MIRVYYRVTARPYVWVTLTRPKTTIEEEIPYELNSLTVLAVSYFIANCLRYFLTQEQITRVEKINYDTGKSDKF